MENHGINIPIEFFITIMIVNIILLSLMYYFWRQENAWKFVKLSEFGKMLISYIDQYEYTFLLKVDEKGIYISNITKGISFFFTLGKNFLDRSLHILHWNEKVTGLNERDRYEVLKRLDVIYDKLISNYNKKINIQAEDYLRGMK